MTISVLPIFCVDLIGSILMIVLSFCCIRITRQLTRRDSGNLIWTYLLWVCYFLGGFAVSRSAGHIVRQILYFSGGSSIWEALGPFSGSINTFALIIVASITLFFGRIWHIWQQILTDRQALRNAHTEMLDLNRNLECRVQERTEALARSEKQIAQADRLASIGQLASGIAHEINNPLGVILGYTQLLIRGEEKESQKHEDLKTIEKHVKNCKAIVADLLSFARSSTPKKASVDVHEAVEDILHFMKRQSDEGLKIERLYGKDIPRLVVDEKKIKQVLINLVMNARHAVGKNGTITLETAFDPAENVVLIRVADTGYGIEEKNLSRIFDPFFTTKPTGEGTGLGLAVSYGIVRNHGGEITVSGKPGEGAVFTIKLPVHAKEEEADV